MHHPNVLCIVPAASHLNILNVSNIFIIFIISYSIVFINLYITMISACIYSIISNLITIKIKNIVFGLIELTHKLLKYTFLIDYMLNFDSYFDLYYSTKSFKLHSILIISNNANYPYQNYYLHFLNSLCKYIFICDITIIYKSCFLPKNFSLYSKLFLLCQISLSFWSKIIYFNFIFISYSYFIVKHILIELLLFSNSTEYV